MAMQNPLCRVILDRYAGQMKLSEQLFIIATGNRVEDKSGANRLSTKLGNRMRTLEFEASVEDWLAWAYKHGVQDILTSFIKFRPQLLNGFDPKRSVNPTPRSWEDVNRIPTSLSTLVFFEHVKGAIGEGAAIEYTQFVKTAHRMPDPDEAIKAPKSVKIPEDPSILYAFTGAVEARVNKGNLTKVCELGSRLSPEFCTILMVGVYKRLEGAALSNKAFQKWMIENASAFDY